MRLIDVDALIAEHCSGCSEDIRTGCKTDPVCATLMWFEDAPTIDAVPVVQYNDLRDDFIDYVCSGVPNPAPYCGNATEKCVDARGWCVNSECKGFTPRGERKG